MDNPEPSSLILLCLSQGGVCRVVAASIYPARIPRLFGLWIWKWHDVAYAVFVKREEGFFLVCFGCANDY